MSFVIENCSTSPEKAVQNEDIDPIPTNAKNRHNQQ